MDERRGSTFVCIENIESGTCNEFFPVGVFDLFVHTASSFDESEK